MIGRKVASKQTGFPGVGEIVGYIHPGWIYASIAKLPGGTWTRLYPGWEHKPVYLVFYKEERYPCTKEEIALTYPDASVNDVTAMFYSQRKTQYCTYPADDLDIFEEEPTVPVEDYEYMI